jgi:hypothetical protein
MLVFMSMFGFIGLAVLVFVWSETDRDFPPLIFKLVASFIAIAFMAMGFGVPISALKQRTLGANARGTEPPTPPPAQGYQCPHCGAGLGQQEVSPSGDVKCSYCQKWWNIHRAGS